jgi:hypothetical protein
MVQETKKTQEEQQQSSQDPAEGRRDIPKGNPSKQGNETEPKHSFDEKSQNKGTPSTEEPAEGRRDVG